MVTFVSVPQAAPLQPAPERDQVTPLLCVSFASDAVKLCVPLPAGRVALGGESEMVMAAPVLRVIVAALDFVPSRFEVAVRLTAAGFGSTAGAV